MMLAVRVFAVLTLLAGSSALADNADEPPHTLGSCGGAMTGYDGQQYSCNSDRKPACEQSTGQRCRCLERIECGGQRDEPF